MSMSSSAFLDKITDYRWHHETSELARAVEEHVKQEDEGKFRCKSCAKLFKATTFVEKHIANKHPELVKQLDEVSTPLCPLANPPAN